MSRPPYKAPAGGNRRIAIAFLAIILAFAIIAYAVAFWPRDDDSPDPASPVDAVTSLFLTDSVATSDLALMGKTR